MLMSTPTIEDQIVALTQAVATLNNAVRDLTAPVVDFAPVLTVMEAQTALLNQILAQFQATPPAA